VDWLELLDLADFASITRKVAALRRTRITRSYAWFRRGSVSRSRPISPTCLALVVAPRLQCTPKWMINTHNHDRHCTALLPSWELYTAQRSRQNRSRLDAVCKTSSAGCMLINLRVWLAARRRQTDRPRRPGVLESRRYRSGRPTLTARFALGLLHHRTSSLFAARGGNLTFCGSRLLREKQSRRRTAAGCCYFLFADVRRSIFYAWTFERVKIGKTVDETLLSNGASTTRRCCSRVHIDFFNRQTTFMLASQLMGACCLCSVCVRTRSFSSVSLLASEMTYDAEFGRC